MKRVKHSAKLSEIEIDMRLKEYFSDHQIMQRSDILRLAFLTESANMNHGCGTYHPRDALKVGTLHNLMIAEILF